MKFSYNWLQQYISQKLPPARKLADILTDKIFEVESIEKKNNDYILDLDILPNRFMDSSNHLGLAREIAGILGLKFKEPKIQLKEISLKTKEKISIEVKDKVACPLYVSRVLEDVKVKNSPKWLKKYLEICGLQSINNIVDATNYIMLETGQPLHCFDWDKLEGDKKKKIIVRQAKKGEEIETLDYQKFELNSDILIIADVKKPLAIAGVKGGISSGINQKTKNIVIEGAFFDPVTIRNSSSILGLSTDASLRFGKKIDIDNTEKAVVRLAEMIREVAGGKILKESVIAGKIPEKRKRAIGFNLTEFKKFAGFEIAKNEIKKIFNNLQFKILKEQKDNLIIEIPNWRKDIEIPEDLSEEILRIYGLEEIPEKLPLGILVPADKNEDNLWRRKIKKALSSLGYYEIYNYSFVSEKDLNDFNIDFKNCLELENPISSEYQYMRPNLIINLLKNSGSNLRYFDSVKTFEIGKVFQKTPTNVFENWKVSAVISDKNKKKELFLELKGVVNKMFENFGVWDLTFDDIKENISWLIKNRSAEIKSDNEVIGLIGEISPNLTTKYNDNFPALVLEIDFEKIKKISNEEREFTPLPKYPSVIRDISLLVNNDIRIYQIQNIIFNSEKEILRDIDLFDSYHGENIGREKKSLSFHLIFRSDEKTLTGEEITKAMNKIISELQRNLDVEIR
jgi:phenylalanyl-tRNA synthetase beta chain